MDTVYEPGSINISTILVIYIYFLFALQVPVWLKAQPCVTTPKRLIPKVILLFISFLVCVPSISPAYKTFHHPTTRGSAAGVRVGVRRLQLLQTPQSPLGPILRRALRYASGYVLLTLTFNNVVNGPNS